MSPEVQDVVERMFEVLVDEIRSSRPELAHESFTVAEIYQSLVPYRTHRDRIGTEMNGDYEHALLRLLAGEGGYVSIESDAARGRLQDELEAVDPDTGIFRNFAACEIRLNLDGNGPDELESEAAPPEWATGPEPLESGPPVPETRGAESQEAGSQGSQLPGQESQGSEPPGPKRSEADSPGARPSELGGLDPERTKSAADSDPESSESPPDEEACSWCRERLPARDDLRFCPFCGSRADLYPCPECGAELEESWLFCLACGTEVGS